MPPTKTDIKNLDGTHLYVCPRCTVTRYANKDSDCPVCGYDQAPDRVILSE